MTQNELSNANHIIDGYHLPHASESEHQSFERAKAEAIKNLETQLANVRSVTLSQFQSA